MEKVKHLEFLQNIISRHNNNSFIIKGWTITVVTALLALGGALNTFIISITALIPIIIFWYLDALYLSHERCFIELYNSAVKGEYLLPIERSKKSKFIPNKENSIVEEIMFFDMNFERFKIWDENTMIATFKSKTIFGFYFALCLITIVIAYIQA